MKFWPKEPKRHMALMRKVVVGGGEMIIDERLPELSPGVYQAEASAYTKEGRVLARARWDFIHYDHEKDLPWIGNRLGVSGKVLKPWTPIEGVRSQVPAGREETRGSSRSGEGMTVSMEVGFLLK